MGLSACNDETISWLKGSALPETVAIADQYRPAGQWEHPA